MEISPEWEGASQEGQALTAWLRERAGWSDGRIALEMRKAAVELGYYSRLDETTRHRPDHVAVHRWRHGKHSPSVFYLRLLRYVADMKRRDFLIGGAAGLAGGIAAPHLALTQPDPRQSPGMAMVPSDDVDMPEASIRLRRALLGIPAEPARPPEIRDLWTRVNDAWRVWRAEPRNYSVVGEALPDLVTDVEWATRSLHAPGETQERREAFKLSATLYNLLRCWFQYLKRMDLCLLTADRCFQAAENSGDDLYIAAGRFQMGHALLANGELEGARDLVVQAAEDIPCSSPGDSQTTVALYGALHLVAAMAAVRSGDAGRARQLIEGKAAPAAEKAGDPDGFHVAWTMFGPTNVALHAMAVESEGGNAEAAVHIGEYLDLSPLADVTRRAYYHLDLARAHEQLRDRSGTFVHLLQMERVAPEFARYSPMVHEIARNLALTGPRSYSAEIRALTERLNVRV